MTLWDSPPTTETHQAARFVTPEQASDYLLADGWSIAEDQGRAQLWTRIRSGDEFQVLVPTDRELRDYVARMVDLIRTLAVVEKRPEQAIAEDLIADPGDTLTLRLLPTGPSGTVPLLNASEALSGLRELVVASTYATTVDQPVLTQGRRPSSAFEVAQIVRLGTPKPGSWSVTARLPLPGARPGPEVPRARRVALQMHRAVRACFLASGRAIDFYTPQLFLERAVDGVSANVCDALTRFGRGDTPYEVRFSWARQLPAKASSTPFRFTPRQIAALRNAARDLKLGVPDGETTISGTVSALRRGRNGVGEITVQGPITTPYGVLESPIVASVGEALYERAATAHVRHSAIRVTGIALSGRIRQVHTLVILGDEHQ